MRETLGFQKPIDSGKRKKVGLAMVRYQTTDSGYVYAECSCGQPFTHPREKVREDKIDKHIREKHNGRGIRL